MASYGVPRPSMTSHATEIGTEIGRPLPSSARPDAAPALGGRVWTAQGAPHAAVFTPLHLLPDVAVDAATDLVRARARQTEPKTPSLLRPLPIADYPSLLHPLPFPSGSLHLLIASQLLIAPQLPPHCMQPSSFTSGSLHRSDLWKDMGSPFWQTNMVNNSECHTECHRSAIGVPFECHRSAIEVPL